MPPTKGRQLQPGPAVGQTHRDDLGTRVRYADHRVDKLALHAHAALDLAAQPNEERSCRIEVGNGYPDVIEAGDSRNGAQASDLLNVTWTTPLGEAVASVT